MICLADKHTRKIVPDAEYVMCMPKRLCILTHGGKVFDGRIARKTLGGKYPSRTTAFTGSPINPAPGDAERSAKEDTCPRSWLF